MRLTSLEITSLRIIEAMQLEVQPGLNFIAGPNGAGKTSVLEAVYLLGRGRSFRHRDAGPMIRKGEDHAVVFAHLRDPGRGIDHRMGLQRSKQTFQCRIDGQDIKRRSALSRFFPLQFISSQPQALLDLGPDVRRRFLDMAVFHVEPDYLDLVSEYQRCLRQRNAALRQGNATAAVPWNRPLASAAEQIDTQRRRVIAMLGSSVAAMLQGWDAGFAADFRYRPGWRQDGTSLEEQLTAKMESDWRLGYTNRGPHRAELGISSDADAVAKKLSRGQQKLLVFALNLALADLIKDKTDRQPILLVDDLASELDGGNKTLLLQELQRRGLQCFLTMIDEQMLPIDSLSNPHVFHVKQGHLSDC